MEISFTKEFLKSKYHLIVAIATLGVGFMLGELFYLIVGAIAYGLSIMFFPESTWWKNKITNNYNQIELKQNEKQRETLIKKIDKQINKLNSNKKIKYFSLVNTCKKIEESTGETNEYDSVFKKLEELLFAYLKILSMEQTLQCFIESEADEFLHASIRDSKEEIDKLETEFSKLQKLDSEPNKFEYKQKLINSKKDKLNILLQRKDKYEQAITNLELLTSEQDRIEQQIKLIRSESVASKNTDSLTIKINSSIEQINEANKWIEQINEFKDVEQEDFELHDQRIGFSNNQEKNRSNSSSMSSVY